MTSKWSITVASVSNLDQPSAVKYAGRLWTFWPPWESLKTWLVPVESWSKQSFKVVFSWSGKVAPSTWSSDQFFDIATSKSGSRPQCFNTFELETRFAPQWDVFSTSELHKVARTPECFTLLTWKCASRHHGVHFLGISTSKSSSALGFFYTFALEICFAPQRGAFFAKLFAADLSAPAALAT